MKSSHQATGHDWEAERAAAADRAQQADERAAELRRQMVAA